MGVESPGSPVALADRWHERGGLARASRGHRDYPAISLRCGQDTPDIGTMDPKTPRDLARIRNRRVRL